MTNFVQFSFFGNLLSHNLNITSCNQGRPSHFEHPHHVFGTKLGFFFINLIFFPFSIVWMVVNFFFPIYLLMLATNALCFHKIRFCNYVCSLLHIVPFYEGPNEKPEGLAKQKQSAIFAM